MQYLAHCLIHNKCDSTCFTLKKRLSQTHRFFNYTDNLLAKVYISHNMSSKTTSAEHSVLRKIGGIFPSVAVRVAQQVVTVSESKGSACLVWLLMPHHCRPEKSGHNLCNESHLDSSPGFVTDLDK